LARTARLLRAKSVIEAIDDKDKEVQMGTEEETIAQMTIRQGDVENKMHTAEMEKENLVSVDHPSHNPLILVNETESFDEQIQRMRSMTISSIGSNDLVTPGLEHGGNLSTLLEEGEGVLVEEVYSEEGKLGVFKESEHEVLGLHVEAASSSFNPMHHPEMSLDIPDAPNDFDSNKVEGTAVASNNVEEDNDLV
jgi:hypothetical protein